MPPHSTSNAFNSRTFHAYSIDFYHHPRLTRETRRRRTHPSSQRIAASARERRRRPREASRARGVRAHGRATIARAMIDAREGAIVVCGDVVLGASRAGAGCAADSRGVVRATTCGRVVVRRDDDGAHWVEVRASARANAVPRAGDDVYARVVKVDEKAAKTTIACARGTACALGGFSGVVRKQDVRATEIDGVDLERCFRIGDVVRARVLSLGDARSFYLTTASDELGVVQARHRASRAVMLPISWTEVQCPVTGEIEERKVAEITEG